ncbi:MAG: resuscitation-promoting factor RpfB [Frankiaceae bacterium]|nr:resuscitation-promoting factor RpfB [Frankiaceae bacterium]
MQWDLPNVRYLRHVHPVRHHAKRASRSDYRAALSGSPQTAAHAMMLRAGWSESEWTCLDSLWMRESNWNTYATNSSSGAYGIPQSLPATKMATAGADWRTNPITQIRWGLSYISSSYGSPCAALAHSSSYGFY